MVRKIDYIQLTMNQMYDDTIILEPEWMDDAIVGFKTDTGQIIYDMDKLIQSFMDNEELSYEEALEFIEYNTIRGIPYMPGKVPIISIEDPYLEDDMMELDADEDDYVVSSKLNLASDTILRIPDNWRDVCLDTNV